jgi:hypothetical protein
MNHRTLAGKLELLSEKTDAARIHAGWNIAPIRVTDMSFRDPLRSRCTITAKVSAILSDWYYSVVLIARGLFVRSGSAQRVAERHTSSCLSVSESGFGFFYNFWEYRFRISIAIQNDGEKLQNRCAGQPDLPVRKEADADGKVAGGSEIGT